MAGMGPDFRPGVDPLPMGNIDIAPTVAHIMGLSLPSIGKVTGRVLEETFPEAHGGAAHPVQVQKSRPAANGLVTLVEYQEHGGVRYLDRACMVAADANRCAP
jgi:arylsulfatase A-like enzyme